MRDLRIVFMGTPEFAVSVLEGIVDAGHNVVGVITAPDRPAGRGRKIQQSAVKEYAASKSLKVLQPENMKSPEFIEDLKLLNPNVQVVVAFRMLPKIVWALPQYGTFNLHASLLPQYRGAAPINWAIINGESATGVSTFFIDEKIDTGAMILQLGVPIEPGETAGELHDKLKITGTKLVLKTLEEIQKDVAKPQKQNDNVVLKDAPKLTKENTRIDWNRPAKDIYNLIRGLNPYPAAWSILKNDKEDVAVKFFEVGITNEDHNYNPGKLIIENKELKVAAKIGFLILKEIQLAGKKKMPVKQLLNGYKIYEDAKLV